MKSITLLFCASFLFLFLDSCTITKRHSGSGYHVEWKKHWKEDNGSIAKKQEAESDTLYAQTSPVSKSDSQESNSSKKEGKATVSENLPGKESEEVNNGSLIQESPKQERMSSQDGVVTEDEVIREEVKVESLDDVAKPEVKRKVEPLTWVAFAFLLVAIGVGLLPASLFSSLTLFIVIFALLLFTAFINAVSSAIRVKRNPEKYKAKPFTWLIVFFCSLGFAFALALIIFSLLPLGGGY